jgi:hypothetical protein
LCIREAIAFMHPLVSKKTFCLSPATAVVLTSTGEIAGDLLTPVPAAPERNNPKPLLFCNERNRVCSVNLFAHCYGTKRALIAVFEVRAGAILWLAVRCENGSWIEEEEREK